SEEWPGPTQGPGHLRVRPPQQQRRRPHSGTHSRSAAFAGSGLLAGAERVQEEAWASGAGEFPAASRRLIARGARVSWITICAAPSTPARPADLETTIRRFCVASGRDRL